MLGGHWQYFFIRVDKNQWFSFKTQRWTTVVKGNILSVLYWPYSHATFYGDLSAWQCLPNTSLFYLEQFLAPALMRTWLWWSSEQFFIATHWVMSKFSGKYIFPDDILKLSFNEQKFPTHLRFTGSQILSSHCLQLWGTGDFYLPLIVKCIHSASSF